MSLPMDFLQSASRTSLEQFELNRLAHSTTMRKQILAILEQWIEDRVAAEVARLLIENEGLRSITVNPLQETFDFTDQEGTSRTTETGNAQAFTRNAAAD